MCLGLQVRRSFQILTYTHLTSADDLDQSGTILDNVNTYHNYPSFTPEKIASLGRILECENKISSIYLSISIYTVSNKH